MKIPDHFVRVIPLPRNVRGVSVPNDDGSFSVYINALYGEAAQRRALEHELTHLARDHFYKPEPIAVQEAEAEGAAPQPTLRRIRLYRGLRALETYLRSIDALDTPVDKLGRPL